MSMAILQHETCVLPQTFLLRVLQKMCGFAVILSVTQTCCIMLFLSRPLNYTTLLQLSSFLLYQEPQKMEVASAPLSSERSLGGRKQLPAPCPVAWP